MKNLKDKKVIVGISGGVDSAVSAALLKEAGAEVHAIFMKNWDEKDGDCPAQKDYQDVIKVCEQLDISYHAIEFIEEYREQVFADFLQEYQAGRTPNPDILCNREIKFKHFYQVAQKLGADYMATGHYTRNPEIDGKVRLYKGLDPAKDQSYFLHAINGEVLSKVLFPVGHLLKQDVRKLAKKFNLPNREKKDSTGICFIGERNFRDFLSNYLRPVAGDFINLKGEVVGRHVGAAFYTIGQRKGLGLGGQGEPWFVIDKNISANQVIVERGEFHPALYADELVAINPTWIDREFKLQLPFVCTAKIRYRQSDQRCQIVDEMNGNLKVIFDSPQRAIAPGQSVVFYQGENCLGGAIIEMSGPSYFAMNKKLK